MRLADGFAFQRRLEGAVHQQLRELLRLVLEGLDRFLQLVAVARIALFAQPALLKTLVVLPWGYPFWVFCFFRWALSVRWWASSFSRSPRTVAVRLRALQW